MGKGKVGLIVVCFVDCSKVLRSFLDQWNQNETHEGFCHVAVGLAFARLDEVRDFEDEEDGENGCACHGNNQSNNALGEGELLLADIPVSVLIALLVGLEDFGVEVVV